MKHWLALAALICFGSTASHAAIEIDEVINSSCTNVNVLVSSSVPTALISSSTQMNFRKVVEVQNLDATANLYVSLSSATASLSATNKYGRVIPSGFSAYRINMKAFDDQQKALVLYAINDGGVGQSTATLTQCGSK